MNKGFPDTEINLFTIIIWRNNYGKFNSTA